PCGPDVGDAVVLAAVVPGERAALAAQGDCVVFVAAVFGGGFWMSLRRAYRGHAAEIRRYIADQRPPVCVYRRRLADDRRGICRAGERSVRGDSAFQPGGV